MVSYHVYKMKVEDCKEKEIYFYFGCSDNNGRYGLEYICFNKKTREYNYPIYKKIRQLGVTKAQFSEKINVSVIKGWLNQESAYDLETRLIDENFENKYCLNEQRKCEKKKLQKTNKKKTYTELKKKNRKEYYAETKENLSAYFKCSNCGLVLCGKHKIKNHKNTVRCMAYQKMLESGDYEICSCQTLVKNDLARYMREHKKKTCHKQQEKLQQSLNITIL